MSQGIFGIIDFFRPLKNPGEIALKMCKFLKGDITGKAELSIEIDNHYILGMKRICVHSYQQACVTKNEKQQSLSLMKGEINNYEHLLKSCTVHCNQVSNDLELVLHYYHLHGYEFTKKMNGLFSIGILDQQKKTFILLNDRFGMAHQVYWTILNNRFCFATHLKTLMELPGIQKEVNTAALNLFLKYSYVVSPHTMFKGIHKIPPGHILVFKERNATVTSYWDFDLHLNKNDNWGSTNVEHCSTFVDPRSLFIRYPDSKSKGKDAVITYKHLLKQSISKRIGNGDNIGILLSGGLDSSANVALAADCSEKPLKTFSIGFTDPKFDERPFARIVARHFNTRHYEYVITGKEINALPELIWHMEEPYFESGLFLTYLGLKSAKNKVDIILGGEGADQLFGTGGFVNGLPAALRYLVSKCHILKPLIWITKLMRGDCFYNRDNFLFKLRYLLNRVADLNHWYFYGFDEYELSRLYKNSLMAHIPRLFNNQLVNRSLSFEAFYHEVQINQDIRHYLNENIMVQSGRMADMLDLTLRESYLDVDLTDFLVSLDYQFKRSGTVFDHLTGNIQTKALHRKTMKNILPAEILEKPKQGGFVPVMIFLKDPVLRRKIFNHLQHSEPVNKYFRLSYLKRLFADYEQVQGKKIYWLKFHNSKAIRILSLLTFDIWYHFFFKNNAMDVSPLSLNEYLDL